MKVYLAGPFLHRDQIRVVGEQLLVDNFEITSTWLWGEDQKLEELTFQEALDRVQGRVEATAREVAAFRRVADKDVQEVLESDALIKFPGVAGYISHGRLVEVGVALAAGIPVYAVGSPENIFDWHHGVECFETVEDVLTALRRDRLLIETVFDPVESG